MSPDEETVVKKAAKKKEKKKKKEPGTIYSYRHIILILSFESCI